MERIKVNTPAREVLVDITRNITDAISRSGVSDGICVVFIPHTTAGVTINENADPAVRADISGCLEKLIPQQPDFGHLEGNSDSHIKASLVGFSELLIIENGLPVLGTWQDIYIAEFDGPRARTVYVKIMAG